MTKFTVKELSDLIEVPIHVIKHWDEIGKLRPAERTEGGKRYYSRWQLYDALILAKAYRQKKLAKD